MEDWYDENHIAALPGIGGGPQPEVIRAPLPQGNRVEIDTVVYLRQ